MNENTGLLQGNIALLLHVQDAHDKTIWHFNKKKLIFYLNNTEHLCNIAFKTTNLMITNEKLTWKLVKVP